MNLHTLSENISRHYFKLFFLESFFNKKGGPLNYIFLKNKKHGRSPQFKISFLISAKNSISHMSMIRDRADIGCSDFEAKYFSKCLSTNTHQIGFIVYPETSIQDTIIDRVEWTIPHHGRNNFSIIKKMKSMIIRRT